MIVSQFTFRIRESSRVTPSGFVLTGNPEVIETASQRTEEIERGWLMVSQELGVFSIPL